VKKPLHPRASGSTKPDNAQSPVRVFNYWTMRCHSGVSRQRESPSTRIDTAIAGQWKVSRLQRKRGKSSTIFSPLCHSTTIIEYVLKPPAIRSVYILPARSSQKDKRKEHLAGFAPRKKDKNKYTPPTPPIPLIMISKRPQVLV
jgi:hypothetical protein